MEHSLAQRAFAETLGTALLVLVGPGSVVATLVLAGDSTPAVTGADLLGISFAFGLVIAALVYALGKVSGCHINPAVTFALAATKRFPWREVPAYWGAQVVGAVARRARHLGRVRRAGDRPRHGPDSFNEDTTTWALGDLRRGHRHVHPDVRDPRDRRLALARRLRRPRHRRRRSIAIIMVIGPITGASLNPARAFGPELVSAIGDGATHWDQLIPVYVLPGLVGAGTRGVRLRLPRRRRARSTRPIREAVTHPDPRRGRDLRRGK